MAGLTLDARWLDERLTLWMRFSYPTETGRRQDRDGIQIPPAYLRRVEWHRPSDGIVSDASDQLSPVVSDRSIGALVLGPEISRNPVFSVELDDALAGSTIEVHWADSLGEKGRDAIRLPVRPQ